MQAEHPLAAALSWGRHRMMTLCCMAASTFTCMHRHHQHALVLTCTMSFHAQVARAMEAQGKLQQAADWLERVCMAVPRDAAILALLGSLHGRLGSEPDALRCCSFTLAFVEVL